MRKLIYAGIALACLVLNSCGPTHVVVESNQPAPAPPPPPPAPEVSYQTFYDALSPYGQWINYAQYGYVWMPNVGPDFKPYTTNGHWVYTEDGWTWASDYPWGWATFHYGRWFFEEGYGWMWIPGYEWAPAWVSWRRSSDYYGWAPLEPSVSINESVGGGYNPPAHYWSFVPQQYVTSPHINNYYVNEERNVTIINNTTVIRNTTIVNNTVNNTTIVNNNVSNNRVTVNNYAGGPNPEEVTRVTGAPLRPIAVRQSNTPGESMSNGGFAIYRPKVNPAPQGNGQAQAHIAPARVQPLTNVRPVNTTIYSNNRGNVNNTNVTNTTTNNTNINNTTTNSAPPTGGIRPAGQNQPFNQPFNSPASGNPPASGNYPASGIPPTSGNQPTSGNPAVTGHPSYQATTPTTSSPIAPATTTRPNTAPRNYTPPGTTPPRTYTPSGTGATPGTSATPGVYTAPRSGATPNPNQTNPNSPKPGQMPPPKKKMSRADSLRRAQQ